ncbi:CRIB domain-containing protein RIC10-like isoform X3 [Lycium ferocissimum]|uniref:CRIB domain-containing protein RIC10-like isoform X3 n=1 Tax=Lycium ferocissimum TaxID=112874 RepID=UPI0028154715|nr:CRIB domain-containing protein RIC10-like isoform X3 [Lycium ferocissimum]
MLITFLYQDYLEEDNGKCRVKGRRISFLFSIYIFVYGITVALIRLLAWAFIVSSMGNKMKGIFKGFKHIFNNFAVKERELEIGCPTDVKHVAHIGWDGPSGNNAPSWMNQFKKGPDFAVASIGAGSSLSPWTSQVGESNRRQSTSEINKDNPTNKEVHVHSKKQKRRKHKANSSPKSSSSSSTKSSRAVKSKAKFVEGTAIPASLEVA